MDPNGKSINPPAVAGVPHDQVGSNERVAPAEGSQQVPVVQSTGTSEETKTIVTVLLLIFVYPIGAIVALFWPKWRWWVKLLVNIPLVLGVLAIAATAMLLAVNPAARMKEVRRTTFMNACLKTYTYEECELIFSKDPNQGSFRVPSVTLAPTK